MILFAVFITALVAVVTLRSFTKVRKGAERAAKNARFARKHWPALLSLAFIPLFILAAINLAGSFVAVYMIILPAVGLVVTLRAFSYWPRGNKHGLPRDHKWITPGGREFDPDA
jgi:hypothetical protein